MIGLVLGINPCVAGLNFHDPSVCLMNSEKIIYAMEEERLNRIRHSSGMFPSLAVEECKKIAQNLNIPITDIAIGFDPELCYHRQTFSISSKTHIDERVRMTLLLKKETGLLNARVSFYPHHQAHAASAVSLIESKHAMCVVFDGTGELSAASIWETKNGQLNLIDSIDMPNSLGYFYAAATAYVGFNPWGEEGKLMALAPYGKSDEAIMRQMALFFDTDEQYKYDVSSIIAPCLYSGYSLNIEQVIKQFEHIFSYPRRNPDSPLLPWHKNFAYCVQHCVEQSVFSYINKWQKELKPVHICCAGGLFMNCKMNGFLRQKFTNLDFVVQPVAGDAGTAIGAAILCTQDKKNEKISIELNELSLGTNYTDKYVEDALQSKGIKYYKSRNISLDCAQLIHQGKIVAWFQGRNELGCRALGHRSILAAPFPRYMSNIINQRVKHREIWRPFACSLLEDFADDVLVGYKKNIRPAYMIEAYPVYCKWHTRMEAVMHVADKTTRPQVVRSDEPNNLYYEMIKYYYKLSGSPMVLNTSLNDKGQPIIQSPEDAVQFFLTHDIDYLIIHQFVVSKDGNNREFNY